MGRRPILDSKTTVYTKNTPRKITSDDSGYSSGKNSFYRAFEERYRGSRELIKSRLQAYMPFVDHCLELYEDCTALDLGCGRGEWLELLLEKGVHAQGVDIDSEVLEAYRELNLPTTRKDALLAMQELSDASLVLVTAFQIVEHLPFQVLQSWVKEAYRVLKPGGLLILETQNPENLSVGAASFYLDPTHQRPIPPLLLAFLPEYYGFERVKILRLQEGSKFAEGQPANLVDALLGVSPDYAVVAQKKTGKERPKLFDREFSVNYGVTLQDLCASYERGKDERFLKQRELIAQQETRVLELAGRQQANEEIAKQLSARLEEIDTRGQRVNEAIGQQSIRLEDFGTQLQHAQETIGQQSNQLEDFKVQLQRTNEAAERQIIRIEAFETQLQSARKLTEQKSAQLTQYREQCRNLTEELGALRASGCWKITTPYRVVADFIKHGFKSSKKREKAKAPTGPREHRQTTEETPSSGNHASEQSKSPTAEHPFATHPTLKEIVTAGIPNSLLSQRVEKIYTTLAQEIFYHKGITNVNFTKLPLCELSVDYSLCAGGNGLNFFQQGLSVPEENFTWTSGKFSRMALSFAGMPTKDLSLLLSCAGIYNHSQRLIVRSEQGAEIFNNVVNGQGKIKIAIPLEILKDKSLYLTFLYPHACSPQSHGESADTRELAFALRSMRFE